MIALTVAVAGVLLALAVAGSLIVLWAINRPAGGRHADPAELADHDAAADDAYADAIARADNTGRPAAVLLDAGTLAEIGPAARRMPPLPPALAALTPYSRAGIWQPRPMPAPAPVPAPAADDTLVDMAPVADRAFVADVMRHDAHPVDEIWTALGGRTPEQFIDDLFPQATA